MFAQRQLVKKPVEPVVDLSFLWPQVSNPVAKRYLTLAYNAMPPFDRELYLKPSDLPKRFRPFYRSLERSGIAQALLAVPNSGSATSQAGSVSETAQNSLALPLYADLLYNHLIANIWNYVENPRYATPKARLWSAILESPPFVLPIAFIALSTYCLTSETLTLDDLARFSPFIFMFILPMVSFKSRQRVSLLNDSQAIAFFLYLKEEYAREATQ